MNGRLVGLSYFKTNLEEARPSLKFTLVFLETPILLVLYRSSIASYGTAHILSQPSHHHASRPLPKLESSGFSHFSPLSQAIASLRLLHYTALEHIPTLVSIFESALKSH